MSAPATETKNDAQPAGEVGDEQLGFRVGRVIPSSEKMESQFMVCHRFISATCPSPYVTFLVPRSGTEMRHQTNEEQLRNFLGTTGGKM